MAKLQNMTRGEKAALTREINLLSRELDYIKAHQAKGWSFYLGDPIKPLISDLERELIELKKKRDSAK